MVGHDTTQFSRNYFLVRYLMGCVISKRACFSVNLNYLMIGLKDVEVVERSTVVAQSIQQEQVRSPGNNFGLVLSDVPLARGTCRTL